MAGFPVHIIEARDELESGNSCGRFDHVGMKLALPMPKKSLRRILLALPPDAAKDKYCRKLASKFVKQCKRIFSECRGAWDIKAYLIREEQFLWDDLLLSITHSGNQKYNALDILSSLRESLLFRYEGEFTESGVLVSWNWHTLKGILDNLGCCILKVRRPFDLRERLRDVKLAHMLADGTSSLLIATREGLCTHWVSLSNSYQVSAGSEWELVPPKFRALERLICGRDIVFATTKNNELYFFTKSHVLKWSHKMWYRVSGPRLETIIANHMTIGAAHVLVKVIVHLSNTKQGALFVIISNRNQLLNNISRGLKQQFTGRHLFDLESVNRDAIAHLAAIDGCTVIDCDGHVLNAGVILDIPQDYTSSGEGARTAAAMFASTFGLAVKVSHDGPITVFENGKVVRETA